MTPEQEQFALDLADNSETHEQWLSIVRFGLKTLIEEQILLVEIISREAKRETERSGLKSRDVSDDMRAIFGELGLRIVLPAG